VVPSAPQGLAAIGNQAGNVHVIVDLIGFYVRDIPFDDGAFTAAARPVRVLDTRDGTGGTKARVGKDQTITLDLSASLPPGASSVALNITVNDPAAGGFLSAWRSGAPYPGTSSVNFSAGQTVANQAVVSVGADRLVSIRVGDTSAHVIVDLAGWYGPPREP
jgi:hypothetical protein